MFSICGRHGLILMFVVFVTFFLTLTGSSTLAKPEAATSDGKGICDEYKEKLSSLENDMKETRKVLTKLIITLLKSDDRKQVDGQELKNRNHSIHKRQVAADDEKAEESDDVLSELPISSLLGFHGKDGRDGRDGSPGLPGRDGRDGAKGEKGAKGEIGVRGATGLAGEHGAKGMPGEKGAKGEIGAPGQNGQPGTPGRNGVAGPPGSRGSPGQSSNDTGAVYTRWGRTICGNQSTLVYRGFAGGSSYNVNGGGTNYQCLPLTPEYSTYYTSGTNVAQISGVEYESQSYGIFPSQAQNNNVPCARCHTNTRSAVMMIPARRTCYSGWTKEYEGYLMTTHTTEKRTTYECVDESPEYIRSSSPNTNGATIFFVVPRCSGAGTILHCPPYIANAQLTCVVCSK